RCRFTRTKCRGANGDNSPSHHGCLHTLCTNDVRTSTRENGHLGCSCHLTSGRGPHHGPVGPASFASPGFRRRERSSRRTDEGATGGEREQNEYFAETGGSGARAL